ncbi:MAG: hypothetical protein PVI54_00455 [Desulfobacteraceae bacterium]|jgi:hypothetical protein
MNGELIEIWGRWVMAGLQGHSQMDMMRQWWFGGLKGLPSWGRPAQIDTAANMLDGWQQVWEPIFKLHMLSLGMMGMVSREKYDALSDRAQALEDKVKEQAQTIDRLRHLLSQTGGENNVVVTQLQDLIGQQSQQFKQLTQSVGEYLKGSATNISTKK